MDSTPLLTVRDLAVQFAPVGAPTVDAVTEVSFELARGETLALVGESGSGKSTVALSILQLLPYPVARHPAGSILFDGRELVGAPPARLAEVRGGRVGMVFQEPMSSLNPLHPIGRQIAEAVTLHRPLGRAQVRARVMELLALVGIDRPERRITQLPHQLSGGQRQRVMIAMALANEPDLLIADEPTTALDVTIQAQILDLLADLRERLGMAVLLITHNLQIVAKMADRVAVMSRGRIVEQGLVSDVLERPQHSYTQALIAAEPEGAPEPIKRGASVLLEGRGVGVAYTIQRDWIGRVKEELRAVDQINLSIRQGQTLGVVGESGSGKSTLGLAVLGLVPSRGSIKFAGRELNGISNAEFRPLRRQIQIVFQDPFGALSPRMSVREIIGEGLAVHGIGSTPSQRSDSVLQALNEVGLDVSAADRYPHEFSGGQRQRIAIARALVLRPKLIILDEPTSALDRSVQAQIVALLRELQARRGLSYLFISHDLAVVRAMSHEIMVMRLGKVVEHGPAERVFTEPRHAYTKQLLAAAVDLETTPA